MEAAFTRALAYPHQTSPEGLDRQARIAVEWDATTKLVLSGGHGFVVEEAEHFNRTVLKFLRSVRGK